MNAAARAKREKVRIQAATMFKESKTTARIASELRVSEKSVRQWRRQWTAGGIEALASTGPGGSDCKLSSDQRKELAEMLDEGPAANGWDDARSQEPPLGVPAGQRGVRQFETFARRLDVIEDRIRKINRIRHLLTAISPALVTLINPERKGHLRLLAQWQSPSGLRHAGEDETFAYLREHKVCGAKALTEKVLTAAHAQTVLAGFARVRCCRVGSVAARWGRA